MYVLFILVVWRIQTEWLFVMLCIMCWVKCLRHLLLNFNTKLMAILDVIQLGKFYCYYIYDEKITTHKNEEDNLVGMFLLHNTALPSYVCVGISLLVSGVRLTLYSHWCPAGPKEQPPPPAAALKNQRWLLLTRCSLWGHTHTETHISLKMFSSLGKHLSRKTFMLRQHQISLISKTKEHFHAVQKLHFPFNHQVCTFLLTHPHVLMATNN